MKTLKGCNAEPHKEPQSHAELNKMLSASLFLCESLCHKRHCKERQIL